MQFLKVSDQEHNILFSLTTEEMGAGLAQAV
jgi:hypothetical protein